MSSKKTEKERCYREIRRVVSQGGLLKGYEIHHIFGRVGLLMVNPHGMALLTREEHLEAHSNKKTWAKERGYTKPASNDRHITDEDYKALRKQFSRCYNTADIKRAFNDWYSALQVGED